MQTALDDGTESTTDEPQVWCLECDRTGALWFGERVTRTVWDRWGVRLGRHEFVERWGTTIGKRHFGGWALGIYYSA